MVKRSKSTKQPIIENYPNGYLSKGITIESERNGLMFCIQQFSGAVSEDKLECCFKKMKKQGDGRIIRDGKIIMRCLFRDDKLIHGMPVNKMKEHLAYNREELQDDISMLNAGLMKQKDSTAYEIYTRTLFTRLMYDPSILKRNMTKYVDFVKQGLGYISFSPPFDKVRFFVEWKDGRFAGVGYIVDCISCRILEKVTFDGGAAKVEVVFPSQYSVGSLTIDSTQWTGDIWNNQANGYGELKDEQDDVIYTGMMLNNAREGTGTSYVKVGEKMVKAYEGMWCNNMKHGEGIAYTTNGVVEYRGVFYEDQHVEVLSLYKNQPSYSFTTGVTSMYIGDNCLNSVSSFSFYSLVNLTHLRIGNNSFQYIHNFSLSFFSKLESIFIGNSSFHSPIADSNSEGFLTISDNPALTTIHIGYHSFLNYSSCSIQNLPALKSLTIGVDIDMRKVLQQDHIEDAECCSYLQLEPNITNSFLFTQSLSIDCSSLQSLTLGTYAFKNAQSLSLHLPALLSLQLELGALSSVVSSSVDLPQVQSMSIHSSCHMQLDSCVALQSLVIGSHALNAVQSIDFSRFTLLRDLEIGEDSLNALSSFTFSDLQYLEKIVIEDNSLNSIQSFSIQNCPHFTSFIVGQQCCFNCSSCSFSKLPSMQSLFFMTNSFVHTTTLHLQELPVVESMEFQRNSFSLCSVVEISGFPLLKTLVFGHSSFINADTVIIENLPLCNRVTFYVDACKGDSSTAELVLKMKNLPKLQNLAVNDGAFEYCGNALLEDMPAVTTVQIKKDCFKQANCVLRKENVASIVIDSFRNCGESCSVILV